MMRRHKKGIEIFKIGNLLATIAKLVEGLTIDPVAL